MENGPREKRAVRSTIPVKGNIRKGLRVKPDVLLAPGSVLSSWDKNGLTCREWTEAG